MKDPRVVGRERRTFTSMANARQRALDLASGSGRLVPLDVGEDMSGDDDWFYTEDVGVRTRGARVHLDETRLPLLLWGIWSCRELLHFKTDTLPMADDIIFPMDLIRLLLPKGLRSTKT